MAIVHRVIDTEVNNSDGLCYIYTRLIDGTGRVIRLKARYEIIVGSDTTRSDLDAFISSVQGLHHHGARVMTLGNVTTYYRGNRYLVLVRCLSYHIYSSILKAIRYNRHRGIYVCRG